MPRTKRLHQLKRPNIRQDWSKWNLYNMSRVKTPFAANRTFFQQKWTAKSMLRAYHNPDVREGTWTRMFDRRLPAVVPMDHRYLAQHDGSEMAGGRGMGADKAPEPERTENPNRRQTEADARARKTPYMHMTFHPLERRLDTAIFRAMFASSTRQARQFVTHGWVKVNGKKMVYPSYQLNPGDMFSVDPERVMFATGAKKEKIAAAEEEQDGASEKAEDPEAVAEGGSEANPDQSEVEAGATAEIAAKADTAGSTPPKPSEPTAEAQNEAINSLRELMNSTRSILEDAKGTLSGKRQQELRDLSKQVKALMSKYRGIEESQLDDTIEEMQTSLADILSKVPVTLLPRQNPQDAKQEKANEYRAKKDAELLAAALQKVRENPIDPTKPYATPWRPRPYMSAFAFIPRYLEVNQNICSAVYLRHPVARPGLAEVPTPYAAETMALGFNWYLRRR